jgi:hypothetical protein
MDRVSFLYVWTNQQIYAVRSCIYLVTSRRGKKIDEREIERGRRRKSKNKSTAINLLLCRQRHSTFYFFIRMVLPLFSSLFLSQLRRWLTFGSADNWLIKLEPCAYRLHCRSKIRLEEKKGFKYIELTPCLQLTISPNSQPSIHYDASSSFR